MLGIVGPVSSEIDLRPGVADERLGSGVAVNEIEDWAGGGVVVGGKAGCLASVEDAIGPGEEELLLLVLALRIVEETTSRIG